jgi:hypothetical protein
VAAGDRWHAGSRRILAVTSIGTCNISIACFIVICNYYLFSKIIPKEVRTEEKICNSEWKLPNSGSDSYEKLKGRKRKYKELLFFSNKIVSL